MKNLLLGLLVLSALVSCGKKNQVSSAAVASVVTNNPITIADPTGVQLGTMIDNYTTQMGTAQTYYYGNVYTYAQLLNSAAPLKFKYTKVANTSTASNNCEKKWIFYVCSYGSVTSTSSTSSTTASRTEQSNAIDVTTKINQLKAIINSAKPLVGIKVAGTSYYIISTDGKEYIIDTRYPLQANPIGIKDATNTEYLFDVSVL